MRKAERQVRRTYRQATGFRGRGPRIDISTENAMTLPCASRCRCCMMSEASRPVRLAQIGE
jgi:hypothetical protein